jgi:hypothetical protein
LEAYVKANPSVTLRKVDIGQWGSPVAEQYGIKSIPYLRLYKDGKLEAEGTREVMARLK